MAGETELERLVVRLLADVEEYIQPLREAVEESKEAASQIEQYTKQTEQFAGSLVSYGTKLSLGVTAPLTALGVAAFRLGDIQESEEIKLRGILEANERQVESLFTDYTTLAGELQKVTTTGDETTIGMFRTAEALGVTGEAAKTAIKESMGLAAAIGMSARGAIRYTAMLAQGDTMMLQRYIPSLRKFEDENERVAEAHRVLGRMFAVAKAEANSAGGQIKQLGNLLGDLSEQIWLTVSAYIKPFIAALKTVVQQLIALPTPIRVVIISFAVVAAAIGPALIALGAFIKLVLFAEAGIKAMSLATFLLNVRVAAYTVATKLATIATIFFKAMSGPAGWALIAAGVTAATATILLYRNRIKETVDETRKLGPVVESAGGKIASTMGQAKTATDDLTTSVEALGSSLKSISVEQAQVVNLTVQHAAAVARAAELEKVVATERERLVRGVPATSLAEKTALEEKYASLLRTLEEARSRSKTTQEWDRINSQIEDLLREQKQAEARLAVGTATIAGMDLPLGVAETMLKREREQVQMLAERLVKARHDLLFPLKQGASRPATRAEEMMDEAREQAKELRDMYATPFEKAKKEIEDLNYLLSLLGKKEFGETYRRGIEKTLKEFRESVKTSERYISPGVETIRRGSVQEAILRQEHRIAVMGKTTEQTTQERQLETLVKIEENTDPVKATETPTTIAIVPARIAGV